MGQTPMAHDHPHPHKITVYHAAAPTCSWSWGYEGVMNRLKLIYGDQVAFELMSLCVWEDFEEYLKEYELDLAGMHKWEKEIAGLLGLPISTGLPRDKIPDNVFPASLATMAAYRQGAERGGRYLREVLRRSCVEAQDVSKRPVLQDAARSAGLDLKKFERDLRDKKGLKKAYGSQGHGWPE